MLANKKGPHQLNFLCTNVTVRPLTRRATVLKKHYVQTPRSATKVSLWHEAPATLRPCVADGMAPMLVPQTAESLRHYTLSFTGPSPAVSSGPSPACSDFSRSTLFLPFPPSLLQHHFALSKLFLWWLRHCAPPFSGRGRRTLEVTTPTALLGVLPPAATLLLPHPSSKSHRLLLPPTVSPWAKPCPSLSQALGTPDLIFGLPFSKPSRP